MRNALVYSSILLVACGGRVDTTPDAHVEADAFVATDASDPADARDPIDAPIADDAAADGGPEDSGALPDVVRVCMIGQVCGESQPCPEGADFRCYGFGESGFCAPFAPECGGFVMTRCGTGRTCIRGGGGDLGYCATDEEMECICTSAAENDIPTDGCPPRFFPDAGPEPRP